MRLKRTLSVKYAFLVFLALVASCGSALDTNAVGYGGVYSLIKVDGTALPFHGASAFTVRGAIDLKSGGVYSLTQTDSATTGALTAFSSSGGWSVTDNAVALVETDKSLLLGLLIGDSLRLTYRSHENVYVRQ
jgi:hypothetical protein